MRTTRTRALIPVLVVALAPAAGLATAPVAATAATTSRPAANEARVGGRAFGRSGRPAFGSRRPSFRRPAARRPVRRPLFGRHGFFGGVLRALGIAYLVHLLFGWGAGGGSPFGLLIVLGIVVWLATRRRRRRRPVYW